MIFCPPVVVDDVDGVEVDKDVPLTGPVVDFADVVNTMFDVVDGVVDVGAVTDEPGLKVCHSDVAEKVLLSIVEVSKIGS